MQNMPVALSLETAAGTSVRIGAGAAALYIAARESGEIDGTGGRILHSIELAQVAHVDEEIAEFRVEGSAAPIRAANFARENDAGVVIGGRRVGAHSGLDIVIGDQLAAARFELGRHRCDVFHVEIDARERRWLVREGLRGRGFLRRERRSWATAFSVTS